MINVIKAKHVNNNDIINDAQFDTNNGESMPFSTNLELYDAVFSPSMDVKRVNNSDTYSMSMFTNSSISNIILTWSG